MPKLNIPGIYVQEVPILPSRVSEVNSAIPAFIGYTHTTKFNKNELKLKPIKVQSMLEFVRFFGESASFTITGVTNNLIDTEQNATVINHFYLYDSLQLYFLNGGGPCYIVSIGEYGEASDSATPYIEGLNALDIFDIPTLYLFPDAVLLADNALASVQQYALRKCGELTDRFSILDVKKNDSDTNTMQAVSNFRNSIGMSYLNYGAAYTPWLSTTLAKAIKASSISGIFGILNNLPMSLLNTEVGSTTLGAVVVSYQQLSEGLNQLLINNTFSDISEIYENSIADYVSGADNDKNPFDAGEVFSDILDFTTISSTLQSYVNENVIAIIKEWKEGFDDAVKDVDHTDLEQVKENFLLNVLNSSNFDRFKDLSRFVDIGLQKVVANNETFLIDNVPYYSSLLKILKNKLAQLPPSGAMAGLYCKTDRERGVWKAPANISVSGVNGVSQLYSNADLADLNIDPVAGKSINVIRPITGYGTMVMGSRTLAGNDSEWRYVPVRRLFIFIKENVKKATAWTIFKPNDRLLWSKVRTQIENYLFELWRQGALAGAKPKHAYQVDCGLNSTMTRQDVLEGKLIVELKLAAIRPDEFILVKFSHQLQKS